MDKSLYPHVEDFKVDEYITNFSKHLKKIDVIEYYNTKIQKLTQKPKMALETNLKSDDDQRKLFRQILGTPARKYPEKEYVMYHCPFHDHDDKKPSFRVNRNGYYCYGCGRNGNYEKFIKNVYQTYKSE